MLSDLQAYCRVFAVYPAALKFENVAIMALGLNHLSVPMKMQALC
jgi:hypothetical protein